MHCRVSESFLDELRAALVLSGGSATEQHGLAGEAIRVDGYCDATAWPGIRSAFRLADDARGNATIRVSAVAEVFAGARAVMPKAVVAVDLAGSYEARERSAGLRMLGVLLA